LLRGDWNLDGSLSNTDIQAMLDALVNLEGYRTAHGLTQAHLHAVGDIDGSSAVTNADIQAMLDLLTSGGGTSAQQIALQVFGDEHYLDTYASSVPEPTSLALLTLSGIALARRRENRH
jgi:hypothetical protein